MALDKEQLRRLPLFSSLADDELIEFSERTEVLQLNANQTIYRMGDAGCSMYILLEGKVRIFIVDRYGRHIVVAEVRPGESFGELPGKSGDVCSATAVTLTETQLVVLNRHSLSYLLNVNPDAGMSLIAALEAHLRHLEQLLARSTGPNRHRNK